MRSTLNELTAEVAEIRALVASITPVNSALEGHKDSLVRQYVTIRRRFDYAAFEKFIENLVAAYMKDYTEPLADLIWRRSLERNSSVELLIMP